MGSLEAMEQKNGSKDRYFQGDTKDAQKLVPEGIGRAKEWTTRAKTWCGPASCRMTKGP